MSHFRLVFAKISACPFIKRQKSRILRLRHYVESFLGVTPINVQTELESARHLADQLEELVVKRGQCPEDARNILLMGYWAMFFDFHKAFLNLIPNVLWSSAFALVCLRMETLTAEHARRTAQGPELYAPGLISLDCVWTFFYLFPFKSSRRICWLWPQVVPQALRIFGTLY
jgi:hypothetical protein